MARFNEILVGRYNRALQKLLSMKGSASLVTLSDEMFPIYEFFHDVENRFLEGWNRFAISLGPPAAGVGNFAGVRFRNPPGSNVIAVFEKITSGNTAGVADSTSFSVATDNADLFTTVVPTLFSDSRQSPLPSLVISQTDGAHSVIATSNSMGRHTFPANVMTDFIVQADAEIPLTPGRAIQLNSNTTNQGGFAVSILWRERVLEESERQ